MTLSFWWAESRGTKGENCSTEQEKDRHGNTIFFDSFSGVFQYRRSKVANVIYSKFGLKLLLLRSSSIDAFACYLSSLLLFLLRRDVMPISGFSKMRGDLLCKDSEKLSLSPGMFALFFGHSQLQTVRNECVAENGENVIELPFPFPIMEEPGKNNRFLDHFW